jgi:peptidoglycan/xylan/chitin deacetylase (PgdA/CDA1 family)
MLEKTPTMTAFCPVAILAYHSIDNSGSVLSTSAEAFREQMDVLDELGVKVLGLDQIRSILRMESLTSPAVVITFDDGFRNVYENGLPVLQRCGYPATVFLVTGYCGRANSWPSQPNHIVQRPLLSWSEIRELRSAGITLGSHSVTHPDLTAVSLREADEELAASKKAIEDVVGDSVETFAYPYGSHNDAVRRLAREHYSLACATELGFVDHKSDLFALERVDMYYLRHPSVFRRLFTRKVAAYLRCRRAGRELRQRMPAWISSPAGAY